jgi:hypothetical protein
MRPLDEIDFEQREGVPYSGWPFSKCHLEPFYERAQSMGYGRMRMRSLIGKIL